MIIIVNLIHFDIFHRILLFQLIRNKNLLFYPIIYSYFQYILLIFISLNFHIFINIDYQINLV